MHPVVWSVFVIAAVCVLFAVTPHSFRAAHIFAVVAMHLPADLRCPTPVCAIVAPHGHQR